MPGLTLRSPSDGESEGTALSVGSCVFQRSFTRCRWLLDPLLLELTSQVETDQPLLSCASTLRGSTDPGRQGFPARTAQPVQQRRAAAEREPERGSGSGHLGAGAVRPVEVA